MTAALARLDLNTPLTPYPLPAPQTLDTYARRFDAPDLAAQFQQAQKDRQKLADDIYTRLLRVAGVPRSGQIPDKPTRDELQLRRWFAQLAVNIVDYIDEDDISTPFNFYTQYDAGLAPGFDVGELDRSGTPPVPDPELPKYWVFGTELPRVLVNEVLAEFRISPTLGPGISRTTVRVWVELHNPLETPPATANIQPQDGFPVRFKIDALAGSVTKKDAGYSPYRVVLATGLLSPPAPNANVLGKPGTVRSATSDATFANPVQQIGGGVQTGPSPCLEAQGYFLLGPTVGDARGAIRPPPAGSVPASTPFLQSGSFEYQYSFLLGTPEELANGLTVLLRRLANPHLPFDANPHVVNADGSIEPNPWYNPYLTIDYLEGIRLNDAAGMAPYASQGKRQPYTARREQVANQVAPGQPTQHTFGQRNNPLPPWGHYDWLVHLDRPLLSPMELLHVSGYQPYQLTQRFVMGGDTTAEQKFQHYVPWFDQTRRLYRVFEFLETHSLATGVSPGGRIPGKINLNTVWDLEVFRALCDPQSANGPHFTLATVDQMFADMRALRTPGGVPAPGDRPFLSLATGYSAQSSPTNPDPQHPERGSGINDTFLRSNAADADTLPGGGVDVSRLFQIPIAKHPYRQAELLTKIFNHLTTRSNVFAVWVTVGFFEVTDATTQPVKLGGEIGRSEGRHVRHRLFAILDRSLIHPDPKPSPRFDPRHDNAVRHYSIID
jgi:hypothetical protein